MKAKCPACGKAVRARLPKGGDGTAVIICSHQATRYPKPIRCRGSLDVVDADQIVTSG